MRALIKLGCVCKVNKMFARLFGGRVGAVLNFFRVEVLTTKKLKIVYYFYFYYFCYWPVFLQVKCIVNTCLTYNNSRRF